MNKRIVLFVLATRAAFPQVQTPLTITQSAGSATGELRLQERRTNGQNYVGIKAPQSVTANQVWDLPSADGTSGQCLTTDGAGVLSFGSCAGERTASDYNWSQTVGSFTGGSTLTLTFTGTSCPAAGTDTNFSFRVYENSTPTTWEVVSVTGGTCTRGGSGTLTASPGSSYTNLVATSASSGVQEAIFSVADSLPISIRVKVGGYYVYSDILTEDRSATVTCDGPGAIFVPMADSVSVFNAAAPSGIRVLHCAFNNAYAKASTKAIRTYNNDGNSFGSLIYDNNITGFSTCVDLQTVYGLTGYAYNRHVDCTDTALFMSNAETGDAGIGLIGPGNIFSDSVTANYGINWNGPGNLKVKHNSFNGYKEQLHAEPKMGVVNVSGTSVTWVSGNKFRSTMAGGGFVAGSTVAATISTYNSSTSLTLATSQPTCTGCSYYVNNTGQFQVEGNTFDSWTWTTHNVRLSGGIPFYNFQIQSNFFSNPNPTTYAAGVTVDGEGWYFGSVKGNNLQTSYVTGKAIDVTKGNYIDINDNQIVNHPTGVNIGASAVTVTTDGNKCANSNTTNCVLSALSTATLREITPVTYTQLSALTAADGSTLYCSNCKQTSNSSSTCATSGSGAMAKRINGAWKCDDGAKQNAFIQSGNSFGATAELGTNDAYGITFRVNGTGVWSLPTTGHWYAASNNTYDIGAGIAANSPRTVYAATSMVAPLYGSITTAAIGFQTDSTTRWNITSAGMLRPATTDTYDIGDLTTPLRVRGVYSKIIDTALSGGTGDYIQTRKLQLFDNTGSSTGATFWDFNVVMSGVGAGQNSNFYIRDNAGSNVVKMERIASGSAVSRTTWYTDLLPDTTAGRNLGSSSLHWGKMWVDTLASDLFPDITDTYVLGNGTKRWSSVRTLDFRADGAITFSSGAVNGYVWTSDASGVGSWQASAAGAWTVSGSDAYRSSGAVWVGKSTNNISAKLEVENSASVNMLQLKYTGAVSSISGGGISAHQGSLPTAADQRLGFMVFGVESGGTQYNRAAIMAFSSQTWSAGSAEGEYLQFLTTSSGSTTRTARWRVDADGTWLPEAAATYSVGSSAARTLKLWTSALDASGAVTMSGSTITASSTFSSDLIATSNATYALGSSSVRWLGYFSTLNVSSTFTLTGTITGDVKFTAANTYALGDSTNYLNAAFVNTYQVFGQVKPASGVTTADLGASTSRFRKLWTGDIDANGTITAPNGNAALSVTKTVRAAGGSADCTLIFSGGLLTGGTC
jgi:hypothetical protein